MTNDSAAVGAGVMYGTEGSTLKENRSDLWQHRIGQYREVDKGAHDEPWLLLPLLVEVPDQVNCLLFIDHIRPLMPVLAEDPEFLGLLS